ncbi:hypothetical protein LTV02_12120 [Nocardia yamanashiensis]|uniref:hypothetical protein n=1 Tax=Nocardia yamanashiensis TaxID=209247 RepID=UPI001E4B2314|nr:hypothetical protein [Nocardia yamanashiensis]UGT44079.1 hypothetical protein LTV02_12120 [Nocardia yamanashiensis]
MARLPRGDRPSHSLPLALVGLGLAYDSLVFGLGTLLGAGEPLHTLCTFRFIGHAVLTPLLAMWVTINLLGWPRPRCRLLTLALLTWRVLTALPGLHLEPRTFADTLRYTATAHAGPPIPALVVSLLISIAGICLWRTTNRPWLALAAVLLIGTAAAAVTLPPLGNAGEAVLLAAVVATARRSAADLARTGRRSNRIAA